MTVKQINAPPALLAALENAKLDYSAPKTLFHLDWLFGGILVGVFGDGANGAYEWFIFDEDTKELKTSNCGYGGTDVAMRDVLVANC